MLRQFIGYGYSHKLGEGAVVTVTGLAFVIRAKRVNRAVCRKHNCVVAACRNSDDICERYKVSA